MSNAQTPGIVPVFTILPVVNETESQKQGRPIFDEMEVVEIRFPGDLQKKSVFPAHAFAGNFDRGDGTEEPMTYAQRFSENYRKFKESKVQTVHGTPVSELPFLTEAKRSELKALNIHTAEQLAALDGGPLKTLGMGGRDLRDKAAAYIATAGDTAENSRLREEIEKLQAENAKLKQREGPPPKDDEAFDTPPQDDGLTDFDALSPDELKDLIEDRTGQRPRGNPSKATLVKMAQGDD